MPTVPVTVDTFIRAESDAMLAGIQQRAGGVNTWWHLRQPTALDQQTVIRMNRDTLYSGAVVDVAGGATLTVPDAGERYQSVMVVNQDHFIPQVISAPGKYTLTEATCGSRYVLVAARILVDPSSADDVHAVHALQDALVLEAASSEPFALHDYDRDAHHTIRNALLELARHEGPHVQNRFGTRETVHPVAHLIATAAAWGGLPDSEATYVIVDPRLPVGRYQITVSDVPVDAFWSVSVYNADGFFEANALDAYTLNSITADRNHDGSVTINFGDAHEDLPNLLPIMDGWNYLVRLYRPRPEILDGSWTFPGVEPRP